MSTMMRVVATLNRAIAEQMVVDVRHGGVTRLIEPQALGSSPSSGPLLLAWERSPEPGWRFYVAAELIQAVCLQERFGARSYPNDVASPVPAQAARKPAPQPDEVPVALPVAANERAPAIRLRPGLAMA